MPNPMITVMLMTNLLSYKVLEMAIQTDYTHMNTYIKKGAKRALYMSLCS
jgi:hypothetical protein